MCRRVQAFWGWFVCNYTGGAWETSFEVVCVIKEHEYIHSVCEGGWAEGCGCWAKGDAGQQQHQPPFLFSLSKVVQANRFRSAALAQLVCCCHSPAPAAGFHAVARMDVLCRISCSVPVCSVTRHLSQIVLTHPTCDPLCVFLVDSCCGSDSHYSPCRSHYTAVARLHSGNLPLAGFGCSPPQQY